MTSTIISSIVLFLGVSILLVVILLVAKKYLVPSGKATITINNDKQIEVETGSSLLSTLSNEKIFLPSACGGGGSCAQCRCQVLEGGGKILPTEPQARGRTETGGRRDGNTSQRRYRSNDTHGRRRRLYRRLRFRGVSRQGQIPRQNVGAGGASAVQLRGRGGKVRR